MKIICMGKYYQVVYECVEVIRVEIGKKTRKEIRKEKLYDEKVLIEYELPSDVKVEEM